MRKYFQGSNSLRNCRCYACTHRQVFSTLGVQLEDFRRNSSISLFREDCSCTAGFWGIRTLFSSGTNISPSVLIVPHPPDSVGVRPRSTQDCFWKILDAHGPTGFYRGLIPALCKTIPVTGLVIAVMAANSVGEKGLLFKFAGVCFPLFSCIKMSLCYMLGQVEHLQIEGKSNVQSLQDDRRVPS